MTYPVILRLLCAAALLSPAAGAQSVDSAATPEMARLAKALAGDWNTVEIVQHGKPVPQGAGRRGTSQVRLTGGGPYWYLRAIPLAPSGETCAGS